jgi:hypothetical protein
MGISLVTPFFSKKAGMDFLTTRFTKTFLLILLALTSGLCRHGFAEGFLKATGKKIRTAAGMK